LKRHELMIISSSYTLQ